MSTTATQQNTYTYIPTANGARRKVFIYQSYFHDSDSWGEETTITNHNFIPSAIIQSEYGCATVPLASSASIQRAVDEFTDYSSNVIYVDAPSLLDRYAIITPYIAGSSWSDISFTTNWIKSRETTFTDLYLEIILL